MRSRAQPLPVRRGRRRAPSAASLHLEALTGDDELLGQHRGVPRLERTDLEALGPGVGELVALHRLALVVVDDDRAALADAGHLPELGVLDPVVEALVLREPTGQRDLGCLPPARELLDHVLSVRAVLLELDDV